MSRLFFTGAIGDIQHLEARYAFECKEPNNEGGKEKVWRGFCKSFLGSKAIPSPPKQFVKFKYQIWFEITEKLAIRCLDASSL